MDNDEAIRGAAGAIKELMRMVHDLQIVALRGDDFSHEEERAIYEQMARDNAFLRHKLQGEE